VQAVGGINEKIEGFFDVCKERGLDGSHAVVIPSDNVKHLMLTEEVVESVHKKLFNVYAVRTIDEAIAALTGMTAGERDENGEFPANTLNRLVEDKLIQFASRRKQFSEGTGDDKGHK
jgi:predicted ATP-dependent protease